MSVIALKWAYSQKVGNATAKNILAFFASHNFSGDTSVFKVRTIMAATEYQETAVRTALQLLVKLKLIIKVPRYGEKGQQLSNEYILNIDKEYAQKFMEDYYDLPTGGVRETKGGGALNAGGGVRETHPLNNNINNNNLNKSSYSSNDKKINKEKINSGFASVESQSNSYNPDAMNKVYPISPLLAHAMKKQGNKECQ